MKLVLGNITFETNPNKAIVHSIDGIINCTDGIGQTPKEVAEDLGEDLCNIFGAYLIPEVYTGEIIYEVDMVLRLDEEESIN